MLRDLEARKSPAPTGSGPRLVFQDLSSVPKAPVRRARLLWIALPALLMVVGAGLGIYVWQPWNGVINKVTITRPSEPVPAPKTTLSTATSTAEAEGVQNNADTELATKTVAEIKDAPIIAKNPGRVDAKTEAETKNVVVSTVKEPPPKTIKPSAPVKRETKVSTQTAARKPVPRLKSAAIPPPVRRIAATKEPQSPTGVEKKMHPPTAQERAESAYHEALDYLQQGRRADAEQSLISGLGVDATHIKGRELLAGLMLQQGHWRQAQELLKQGITVVPGHYAFVQLLARIQVEQGDEAGALALMERSAGQAQQDPGYLSFMATLYQRAGRHPEAVEAYSRAVRLNPQQGRWWLGLAISLEAAQNHGAAADAYQRAVQSGGLDSASRQYAQQRLVLLKNR